MSWLENRTNEQTLDDMAILDDGAFTYRQAEKNLSNETASILQARLKESIILFERELWSQKQAIAEIQRGLPTVLLIETFAPEPLDLIKPFHVTVAPYEDEYRADFLDANLSAFGENRSEAIRNLKDIIAITFLRYAELGSESLGPGPAREYSVLRDFLRKRD